MIFPGFPAPPLGSFRPTRTPSFIGNGPILKVRWRNGDEREYSLIPEHYDYLCALQGTGLERSYVTLRLSNGSVLHLDLGALAAYKLGVHNNNLNPLNSPEYYENPLS